jgi:5-methyltetrahydrofolate--homocysteine methyltransferase
MTTVTRTTLRDLIAARGCALFDGAMGTMLQGAGLEAGESGERWNLERAEAVADIHRDYAAAGSVLVTTNTFGATAPRLSASGLGDRVADVNAAAVRIARAVADEFGALVAGDVGPTGELIEPLGTLSPSEAQTLFGEQIEALAGAGADLILGETLSDLAEAEAVVRAAHDAAPELEVAVTLSFDTNRHTMMGVSPAQAVERLGELGVTAVGANCGRGLEDMDAVMVEMVDHRPDGLLLIAQSNAGLPVIRGEEFCYETTVEEMAAYALRMRELGVELVGGCCGSTPAHMAAMASALSS